MIGRRAAGGFVLLCALLFSAFASQSAFAEIPETTVFECSTTAAVKDFSDEHCDKTVTPETGSRGHTKFPTTATEVTGTNEKTAESTTKAVASSIEGEVALTKTKITCTKVAATGSLKNEEPAAGKMQASGTATVSFSGCTVEKPLKCVVAEPITAKTSAVTKTNLGAGANEMGVEFKPEAGLVFATIEYLNKGAEACGLNGQKFTVEGTATGTGSLGSSEAQKETGATMVFGPDNKLTLGGKAANFTATVTLNRKSNGNPLTLTTPPYHT
jgi:hypothetical protein